MKAAAVIRGIALALVCLVVGALVGACEPDFDPSNKLITLRVLAVRADNPYPKPGSKVHLEMLWHDGKSPLDEPRKNIQILWIGGCFDPVGDLYYGCYADLAKLFGANGQPSPDALKYFGTGNTFDLEIPADIVSRRPVRENVDPYGVAFIFFAVCAGQIRPTQSMDSATIPLGCYDDQGNALGADDFVPGYLTLYSYDNRANKNPIVTGLAIAGQSFPETEPIPDTHVAGCSGDTCAQIEIKPSIDPASAEVDPGAVDPEGTQLTEMLWVNYYTTAGKLIKSARLVNDSTKGWNEDNGVKFEPPPPGEKAEIFVVVHDNRGGIAWIKRRIVSD